MSSLVVKSNFDRGKYLAVLVAHKLIANYNPIMVKVLITGLIPREEITVLVKYFFF